MTDWVPGTIDPDFKPHVTVRGVGRVGTYASAAQRHRSRARRFWQVEYWDGTRGEHGYVPTVVEELGPFKTKKLASAAAKTFADEKGWTLSDYAAAGLPIGQRE